jgi:uncharacterized radical SAM protein YgiQ
MDVNNGFLPISREEMRERKIEQLDFVYVIGDAYVDHPSFGHGIISRVLEANGYTVGILSQPDWKKEESIQIFGEPKLGFLVSSGNMDSMVNHYFVSKKKRPKDAYTPGGHVGKRPDYAVVVYGNLIRKTYKKTPIILGGIEASLRRMAHYDYWSNQLKRSILLDSGADLISYGMGERSMIEIAHALKEGIPVEEITFVKGTVFKCKNPSFLSNSIILPSYEEMKKDKRKYANSFSLQYENTDPYSGKNLIEPYGKSLFVVQNSPSLPLSTKEMDIIYSYPYERKAHPSYEKEGGVPATEEIKFSITSSRGCFGGCNFCALTFHQGRIIQSRSHASIIEEAKGFVQDGDFKGYIHDVGGPTANFRKPSCEKQKTMGVCPKKQCLFPSPCEHLTVDHEDYLQLLRKLRKIPQVKKVFIRSGIRYDYLLADKKEDFFKELVKYHISGQLKVAPEHVADTVLDKMGKPKRKIYEQFYEKYKKWNEQLGMKQFLVPYLMSSHPGSTLKEAVELGEFLRDMHVRPEQVQDFYPTPSTVSTVMYYTGVDPRTMEEVYTPKNPHEKAMQRALLQYTNPKNAKLVREALIQAGREDLIGYGRRCLLSPLRGEEKRWIEKRKEELPSHFKKKKKKKTIRNIHKKRRNET